MKGLLLLCCCAASMWSMGCASIVHGPTQAITFSSNPSGAEVIYNGGIRGRTPCQVSLKRRNLTNMVVIRMKGFQDQDIEVKTGVSMFALLGNILIGGVPGYIIDAATGSFGHIYTESYSVDLVPSNSMSAPQDGV